MESFLFSYLNNEYWKIKFQAANNHNFLHTLDQIEVGINDGIRENKQIYQLRQDERLAKTEETKLQQIFNNYNTTLSI